MNVATHAPATTGRTYALGKREIVMNRYSTLLQQFLYDEQAVTAIEYGLIAALIAVVIIASVQLVGTNLSTVFSNIAAAL